MPEKPLGAVCGSFDAAMQKARNQIEWFEALVVKEGLFVTKAFLAS
jgi:hypothetical protein